MQFRRLQKRFCLAILVVVGIYGVCWTGDRVIHSIALRRFVAVRPAIGQVIFTDSLPMVASLRGKTGFATSNGTDTVFKNHMGYMPDELRVFLKRCRMDGPEGALMYAECNKAGSSGNRLMVLSFAGRDERELKFWILSTSLDERGVGNSCHWSFALPKSELLGKEITVESAIVDPANGLRLLSEISVDGVRRRLVLELSGDRMFIDSVRWEN